MRRLPTTTAALLVATVVFAPTAHAQSGAEQTAIAEAEATAERQARGEIGLLLNRLCPGRCELVDLQVEAAEPEAVGGVRPGFEGAGGPSQYDVDIERVEATVMMDSTLPENFQTNLPTMAQFRLQDLADEVVVAPVPLEFPEPQAPPTPDDLEDLMEPPPQPPEPQPEPTDEAEDDQQQEDDEAEVAQEDDADEQDEDETLLDAALLRQALPWIALLLTLLILGGLIILILRRLESMAEADDRPADPRPEADDGRAATMPDTGALREELTGSRSALNRMLRDWIEDDPEQVARLVRLVGPDILSDLRRDPEMRPSLEIVSDHVAALDDELDAQDAGAVARTARSRYEAELVVDDGTAEAEWDFLEGLTLAQITKLLDNASRREKGFVLTRLPPVLRSRYLEGLDSQRRRELLMEASSSEQLSKTESRKLAGRLRQIADEFTDAGREAEGRAQMLTEMLDAMDLNEQTEVLDDMLDNRPDVAEAVLSRICLESAIPEIPEDMIADTVHRMPVDTLAEFLQGINDEIANRVLDVAPASKRQAVSTELSLDIPTSRADFLDARRDFADAIIETLKRNGYDVARFNASALEDRTPQSSTAEVAP